MNAATKTGAQVPPVMIAALLLAARGELIRHGLPHPGADEVFAATGAGRTRAYKLAATIPNVLAGLVRPTGRPPSPPPAPPADSTLSRQVLAYLMDHSGSVTGRGQRRSYSTGFRCFILGLIEEHPRIELTVFAPSVGVPLPTLRDWLHAGCPAPEPPKEENLASDEAATARVETIVQQWERWRGDFVPFCDHLRQNLHIPYGRTLIAGLLEQLGLRTPCRRPGRSPDEKAMQDAFETFFPGAQWQGDGSPIVVRVFGQAFVFNLELMVDARTGAVTGVSVRDNEDGAAVIEAFDQGVGTTGSGPIVLELDGRPPNHSDEVVDALGETILMASTPGRPQSNPFVEGAHSLFQNAAPALAIEQAPAKDVARQLLELTATVWARVLNHKPRLDRGGRSRAQLYQEETPTEDQERQARDSLRKRCRRQDRALETLRRRQNPVVLEMLGS
ncbi:MAG: hypothetical protein KJ993_14570, partial [Actinobacteria bacterium]|nr:hypothetical protein [Actinomycetota bacterium]